MKEREDVIDGLNDLLTRCYDSEQGYTEAGNNVESAELRKWMFSLATQRKSFGHEIKEEIRRLGGKPDKGSSWLGTLHRAWIDIKGDALGADNMDEILEECKQGEERALEDYDKMLNELSFDAHCRTVVQKQRDEIARNLSTVANLEEVL